MIFGKTDSQRWQEERERDDEWAQGTKRFAYLPVRLYDGQYVWLQPYWSYRGMLWKNVILRNDGTSTVEYRGENYGGSRIRNHLHPHVDHILWKN